MGWKNSTAMVLGCMLAAAMPLCAQNQNAGGASGSGQSQPAAGSQNPSSAQQPSRTQTQSNSNPFPEDTSDVPVMPTKNSPDLPPGAGDGSGEAGMPMPAEDVDPVRSPADAAAAASQSQGSSSSSRAGMDTLLPPADDDTQPAKRNKKGQAIEPEHQESAAEDENVGNYYLDNKDWKAALSRFQSALVLDPDNPDVYWGLAESERHLGDFAGARANYQKVTQYDPDSRHGKDARKALKDPEIANAKPSAPAGQPSP